MLSFSQDGGRAAVIDQAVDRPLLITSKPTPGYSEEARRDRVTGTVVLRVVFLASGDIGTVSAVKKLGSGLTEKAIEAAQKIKFKPAVKNGIPVTVVKSMTYAFRIK